jgi:hypothetical protein
MHAQILLAIIRCSLNNLELMFSGSMANFYSADCFCKWQLSGYTNIQIATLFPLQKKALPHSTSHNNPFHLIIGADQSAAGGSVVRRAHMRYQAQL